MRHLSKRRPVPYLKPLAVATFTFHVAPGRRSLFLVSWTDLQRCGEKLKWIEGGKSISTEKERVDAEMDVPGAPQLLEETNPSVREAVFACALDPSCRPCLLSPCHGTKATPN